MKPNTIKIFYWLTTLVFCILMTYSGISELMQTQQSRDLLINLGFPFYLNYILGVAKILGVIGIIQWKFKTIKEWAYAGFTIDFIGASASFALNGFGVIQIGMPIILLVVMFVSYFLEKKVEKK